MEHTQTTKEKIARAAIELIADRGIDAVSMRDISRQVGVSEAALYRHFPNKNELIWEVFTTNYDQFAEHLARLSECHTTIAEKLEAMIDACCEFFDRDCDLFVFLLVTQHIQRFAPKNYQAALQELLHSVAKTAITNGEIPDQDVELTSAMIMGCVIQTALFCLYQPGGPTAMSSHSKELTGACRRIIKGN